MRTSPSLRGIRSRLREILVGSQRVADQPVEHRIVEQSPELRHDLALVEGRLRSVAEMIGDCLLRLAVIRPDGASRHRSADENNCAAELHGDAPGAVRGIH